MINSIRVLGRAAACFVLSVLASACGGSGVGPSSTAPRISAVVPGTGTTTGGTAVTILGANFAAGATVTIGSAVATDVTVASAGTITAKTPPHAAGAADVNVVSAGQSATLPGAYMFVAPVQVVNAPPVITSIVARGTVGPNEPAQFADLDETVRVTAAVTDAETAAPDLIFTWTANAGAFTGSGPSVLWTAPRQFSTPGTATLTLTVTERYQTTDAVGLPVTRENVASSTSAVRVHNSVKEVGDLAFDFLDAFSKQLNPDFVVRNFTNSCGEAAAERADVVFDQQNFKITSYTIGAPVTSVPFSGSCPFRNRVGDACSQVRVAWTSTQKSNGVSGTVTGTDQVTAVIENDQWKLCASDFNSSSSTFPFAIRPFKR